MAQHYKYEGVLDLTINELPSLEPVLLSTRCMRWCRRLCSAGRRRRFSLTRDWAVTVTATRVDRQLTGVLVVPRTHDGELQQYDGASVPCPWWVSALSMGMLRPLGVMLTASIIHDFAFAHGYLLFKTDGRVVKRKISRRDADRLFRDVIATVNDLHVVAWIGYAAVRLGWLGGVKYAGKRWTRGAVPWAGVPVAVALLGVVLWGVAELGPVAWAWFSDVGGDRSVVSGCKGLLLDAATLYLIPSGVLVTALGVAKSEVLKTGVSGIGLFLAGLWGWSTLGLAACSRFEESLLILPWVFVVLWVVSLAAHAVRWCRGN